MIEGLFESRHIDIGAVRTGRLVAEHEVMPFDKAPSRDRHVLVEADTKIGYEISFTRHFYQPPQLRTLAEISADILALEQETEGLLSEITKGVSV